LKEGGESNRIYIIKEGQVSLYKKIPSLNYTEKNLFKAHKLLDLAKGDIFGEDKLFFNCPNRYTIKVTSIKIQLITIENVHLQHNFRRLWPDMLDNFKARNIILNR
jgi:CRP-like cAMP-binding protein